MWSGGFVWKHFKNNTLCCGDSFQAASSYYGFERWGRQGRPWCGVRPLLFNLSSRPWRPPPSQLSSLHMLLHLLPYSSDPHQSSSAAAVCIKKGGRAPLLLSVSFAVSLGPGSDYTDTRKLYQISEVQRTEFLFVLNQQKYTVKKSDLKNFIKHRG